MIERILGIFLPVLVVVLVGYGYARRFRPDGIRRLAEIAFAVNERQENIGARRLYTVMERLLDDLSFHATKHTGDTFAIDAAYVDSRLGNIAGDENLARYIL